MAITPSTYDKALMARINTGTGLLGKEKAIAKRVPPSEEIKKPYSWERVRTNPIARGLGAAAVSAGILYGFKKSAPVFQKMRNVQQTYLKTPPGKVNKIVLDFLDKFPDTLREKAIISEERIAKIKGVSTKTIASTAASTAVSGAATSYLHRQRHANDLLDQSKDKTRSYVRTKLAGIPTTLIDDGAIYLTKAVQLVEQQKADKADIKSKPIAMVKKELADIEKRASPVKHIKRVAGKASRAIIEVTKHPIHAVGKAKQVAQNISDKVAPGAWGTVEAIGSNAGSPPGTSEVAATMMAMHHTARHLGKGIDAGIQKSKPFLSKAKERLKALHLEVKEGPK